MKLGTVRLADRTAAARLDGDTYIEIDGYDDVGTLLAEPHWRDISAAADGPRHDAVAASVALLVPQPSKILCVGLNYRSHIEEMGRPLPEYPTVFAKFADTVTGPYDDITAVADDPELDWEGELAVVIGATTYRVTEHEAAASIAGYTVANDISMRGWQYRSQEWLQGKIWARSTPIGPVLTTADEFDPTTARLTTTVNGEVMQDHPIADLLFTPAHLVAYLSQILPLRAGDVILTGTPGGVGHARDPKRHLAAGDVVEVTIDQLGSVSNRIVEDDRPTVPIRPADSRPGVISGVGV
ncbi:fumarylacetoacetate hydrolase family protein [Gordonia sp. CPCC 205515]|uniref:fumarylacetoacetate hydrolase family protein n=1 Tax=Gordonia sp. CPCC 205515 TaxID=3140791 RepID=UPI003AF36714